MDIPTIYKQPLPARIRPLKIDVIQKGIRLIVFSALVSATAILPEKLMAAENLLPETVAEPEPTVVGFEEYNDPLESFNRRIFAFNDVVYSYVLIPVSNAYTRVLPLPLRNGIANVFSNIQEPVHALNHSLQGDFPSAGRNLLRFASNTTIGILGIFDAADTRFDIPAEDTSLNETFMRYRIGQGAYLVLPILGPSDLRSGSSRLIYSLADLHPIKHFIDSPESSYLIGFDNFQEFAPAVSVYTRLRDESEDPYLYFRNQYLQGVMRDQETLADGE